MNEWTPDKIKELRISMKLTQQVFAECVGVTRVYVNYLEKGVRTPNKTLCFLLDCMEMKKESDVNVRRKRKASKRDL